MADYLQITNFEDAFILEMDRAKHSKHGKLLGDSHADVMTKLNTTLDWIRSEEGELASLETVKSKVDTAETEAKEAFKPWFDAVEADRYTLSLVGPKNGRPLSYLVAFFLI